METPLGKPLRIDPMVVGEYLFFDSKISGFKDQLYRLFIATSQTTIDDIYDALRISDYETITFRAHKLKGASYTVGAMLLAEHCGILEAGASCRDYDSVNSRLREIERERDLVAASLVEFLHAGAASRRPT